MTISITGTVIFPHTKPHTNKKARSIEFTILYRHE